VSQIFKLLVFDWDGTLMDSVHRIVDCIKRSAVHCRCRVPSDRECRNIIGLGLDEALETLFPGSSASTKNDLIESYRTLFLNQTMGPGDLFAGVSDLLSRLKAEGYLLAIATGKGRSGLGIAMQKTGIQDMFDASRCADETASKPAPAMLLELMDQCGVTNDQTLMIGDTVHDLKMAKNAGVNAVAVTCGADEKRTLMQFAPLGCLAQTADLANFLCCHTVSEAFSNGKRTF